MKKGRGDEVGETRPINRQTKSQITRDKGKKPGRRRRKRSKWSQPFSGVVTSDLMFSMVSSGIGATVCTAGRFLLVAPLTKDEEEEEDEEAESVAPGRGGESRCNVSWRHDRRWKDQRSGQQRRMRSY